MNVSVIVPKMPGEPLAAWTASNFRRELPQAEVIEIEDSPPLGVGPRRHQGILQAAGEVVIVADAHTDPLAGCVDKLLGCLEAHPDAVACAACVVAHQEHVQDRAWAGLPRRYAARPVAKCAGHRILRHEWHTERPKRAQPVALAMGGVYALRRDRYLQIGAPWQYLRGKGWSEQALCIANWRCHGDTWIVPGAEAAHVWLPFASSWTVRTWVPKHNQLFLVHALCDDDQELLAHLALPANSARGPWTRALLKSHAAEKIGEALKAANARTWADYRQVWGV